MRAYAASSAPARGNGGLLAAYACVFYAFLYGPLVFIAVFSFNESEITGFPFTGWSLQWYERVFTSPELVKALGNSLLLGVVSGVVATAIALSLALAFRFEFRGKSLVLALVLLPIIVPGIIGGIVLLIFFGYLGVRSHLFTTVLVAHVNWVLPFAFLTLYPRVHNFDRSLEEAAMDLGARPLAVFRRVLFPILRPGVIATALFSFSLSFDEFVRTVFVIGFDRTVPVAFWGKIVDELAPELPAMAVITILISVAGSLLGFVALGRADRRPA